MRETGKPTFVVSDCYWRARLRTRGSARSRGSRVVSTHRLNTQRMSAVQKVWSSHVCATILLQHGPAAQSSIALSTIHSEHAGLSHSMQILIPVHALLLETIAMLELPVAVASTICCRTHEDNASALLLANSQHLNNRNKCLAVKLHHFWSFVKPGVIEVVKCETSLMLADPCTKPLVREVFERLRVLIMGWSSPSSVTCEFVGCSSEWKNSECPTTCASLCLVPWPAPSTVERLLLC
jgi:hypothetical protein